MAVLDQLMPSRRLPLCRFCRQYTGGTSWYVVQKTTMYQIMLQVCDGGGLQSRIKACAGCATAQAPIFLGPPMDL